MTTQTVIATITKAVLRVNRRGRFVHLVVKTTAGSTEIVVNEIGLYDVIGVDPTPPRRRLRRRHIVDLIGLPVRLGMHHIENVLSTGDNPAAFWTCPGENGSQNRWKAADVLGIPKRGGGLVEPSTRVTV